MAATNGRNKASVSRTREHRSSGANKVLAERNPAVVAVGAWVEDGQDFPEHPSMKPDRRIPHTRHRVWTQHVPAGERMMSAGVATRQRVMEGSSWEKADYHVLRGEQKVEEEEEDVQREEEGDDHFFTSRHECPLVQQKVSGRVLWDTDKSQPDPDFDSRLRVPQVLWPLTDQEELRRRQRQSQFLMQRRQFMNTEREQVKDNKQHRKHLKRTARIKAEKEQIRLEEERKLERARQLTEAKLRLEERELLILERLKLEEEEEERAAELQRRKKEENHKVATSVCPSVTFDNVEFGSTHLTHTHRRRAVVFVSDIEASFRYASLCGPVSSVGTGCRAAGWFRLCHRSDSVTNSPAVPEAHSHVEDMSGTKS
ncbi:hypothetical protein F2P81_008887 [Scophthalmus maximus]|uniref:Uncharacterized protein n=1 Tax=Scophthalmus maximus TaxID=52904 RepID=A0A6A4SX96_SCOMX|nr:hypothetical protein F2P81_008887 [Scophthalmus maximus]